LEDPVNERLNSGVRHVLFEAVLPGNPDGNHSSSTREGDVRSVSYPTVILSVLAISCGGDGSGPPGTGPAATITAVAGAANEGQAGTQLSTPLTVKVSDANGNGVPGKVVNFTIPTGGGTLSATTDTTDAAGLAAVNWTLGQALGAGRVEARTQGVLVPAIFNVTIRSGPAAAMQRVSNAPGASAGGFELSDSVAIRVTDQFGNPVSGTAVTFAVTVGGGTVSPATGTTDAQGNVRTNWVIGPTGGQTMTATAGALSTNVDATATACTQTTITPGNVLAIGPADARCVVLGGTASRYFVTVVNGSPAAASTNGFRMRGVGAGTSSPNADVVAAPTVSLSRLSSAAARAQLESARAQIETHDEIMRANERVMQTMLPQLRALRNQTPAARMRSMSVVPVPPPNVGDTLNMRIPGNFGSLCSLTGASSIRARVVFVGQHGVMLEDVTNQNAMTGQIDTLYVRVGQEFDTDMWTLLNANFGNPLAMDTATDNNERFYMVFSSVVNNMQGGTIAGFVASSDFLPPAICPASNLAEVFYARVPTVAGPGTGAGTALDWYRRTRTVMVHEVKHIVSFAERFARGFTPTAAFNDADRWLEESSAMMAEELWGRTVFNLQPETNVDYRASIHCEVRLNEASFPECPQPYKPLNIFDHFILLYEYMSNVEGLSPIGVSGTNDFSYYGSGWSFLRWVIDNYGVESTMLSALTRETSLPGVQNIEARTGRTFAELVKDWSIAMVLDDYPGFTPADPRHAFAGWNARDIFAGMNRDFSNQGFFIRPFPLVPRSITFGRFGVDVSSVRGGSMAVFEVTGTQTANQMLEFRGLAGTAFPADMRVNIIRVQ
jgi:hypothetical protein